MTLSQLFTVIGAPLRNDRWSWGSVRDDGIVILRVWQGETVWRDGRYCVQITNHEFFRDGEPKLGYYERNQHIDLIRAGSKCYMVMCESTEPPAIPRKVKRFNSADLFVAGLLSERDGDSWLEWTNRIPMKTVTRT